MDTDPPILATDCFGFLKIYTRGYYLGRWLFLPFSMLFQWESLHNIPSGVAFIPGLLIARVLTIGQGFSHNVARQSMLKHVWPRKSFFPGYHVNYANWRKITIRNVGQTMLSRRKFFSPIKDAETFALTAFLTFFWLLEFCKWPFFKVEKVRDVAVQRIAFPYNAWLCCSSHPNDKGYRMYLNCSFSCLDIMCSENDIFGELWHSSIPCAWCYFSASHRGTEMP